MKTKNILLLITLHFSLFAFCATPHKFTFKIKGMQNTQCILGCYFGDKSYVMDSAKVDEKGNVTFAGDTALPAGVYFIILKNKNYFEFFVDKEQKFSMSTDTTDLIKYMKIEGSVENQIFYDYRRHLGSLHDSIDHLSKEVKSGPNKEAAKKNLDSINSGIKRYTDDIKTKHPDFLLTSIFKASDDPALPPIPTLPNGRKDSSFASRWYKTHYWDNIDFSDSRMVRTPPIVFFDKLKDYITKWTFQIPDSIDAAADYLIAKSRKSPDMFKFLVYYVTNTYENSNIMGLDEVFVHMVKKYYTPDQAFWVSASQLDRMRERADQLEPILLGKNAPEIALPDTSLVTKSLHEVKANYTIVFFWDYDCGLCQQETPKLIKWYDSAKGSGIQVYAVQTNYDPLKWKEYIIKHNLDWINVCDVYRTSTCQHQYDVISTPMIYVLDKNKKIIAKKIDIKDLNNIIKHDMLINEGKK